MNILEKIAIFGLADDTNSRRSRDMKEVTTGRSSGSIWHRVSSLWDTLGLSVILGLIMMFVGSIGVNADFNQELGPLIWAVIICLGVAYEKVASKGNAAKTAGAGAASAAIAATIMNLKGVETPDLILAVRFIFYPFLAWTVVTLERLHLASLASAWKYLAPLVLLPGIAVGLEDGLWKGVAEVVFAAGCAMILHAKKVPAEQAAAPVPIAAA